MILEKSKIPNNLLKYFDYKKTIVHKGYISHLCDIFDEVKRVLRDDGTCWVNLGDTYYGGGKDGKYCKKGVSDIQLGNKGSLDVVGSRFKNMDYKDKCLTMIPQRFAIEMVDRGWILRNVIIWHKPNCMPSSVKDRFTVDFEYIFYFSKKKKYYFETQREPHNIKYAKDWDRTNERKGVNYNIKTKDRKTEGRSRSEFYGEGGRNKRTVWTINPKPFKEAHFAVYPEELCETPIKAGCPKFVCVKCGNPKVLEIEREGKSSSELMKGKDKSHFKSEQGQKENIRAPREAFERKIIIKGYKPTCNCNTRFTSGIVLDPFFGAGTTGLVALKQGKKFIGIELNPEYIKIANKRLKPFLEQSKL